MCTILTKLCSAHVNHTDTKQAVIYIHLWAIELSVNVSFSWHQLWYHIHVSWCLVGESKVYLCVLVEEKCWEFVPSLYLVWAGDLMFRPQSNYFNGVSHHFCWSVVLRRHVVAWQLQCAKTSATGAQTMPGGHFSISACSGDIPLNFLSCIFPHCLHNGRDG